MARTDDPIKFVNDLEHRYILEKYSGPSSRITCPNCRAKHSYARYVDVTNGEFLDERYGKCNRAEKCGYFVTPYGEDIKDKTLMVERKKVLKEFKDITNSGISLIRQSELIQSLTFKDNFSKFLFSKFDPESVIQTLLKYKVGESPKWDGATVFWQIDRDFDIRTGKIILYNVDSGKRVKEPYPHVTWEHVADKGLDFIPDYNLSQCLFGEHLISDDVDTYHIVEAEKTAIICNINTPNRVWLSVGGIELISPEKIRPLEDKSLIFYPDKGEAAYKKWSDKLKPLIDEGWDIKINRGIEKTELNDGEDLADMLLKRL